MVRYIDSFKTTKNVVFTEESWEWLNTNNIILQYYLIYNYCGQIYINNYQLSSKNI